MTLQTATSAYLQGIADESNEEAQSFDPLGLSNLLQSFRKLDPEGFKLCKLADCNNFRSSPMKKPHGLESCRLALAVKCAVGRAFCHAYGSLRCLCLQDCDVESATTAHGQTTPCSEAAYRRRDAYLRQLGIRHHADKRCYRGRRHRAAPRSAEKRASEYLDLIHEDIPITRQSTATGETMMSRQSSKESVRSWQSSLDESSTWDFSETTSSRQSSIESRRSSWSSMDESSTVDLGEHLTVKSGPPLDSRAPAEDLARMKFLRKLSYQRVWVPRAQRAPAHQTLIIFDWDDTLLCTTYLSRVQHAMIKNDAKDVPAFVKLTLNRIETAVTTLLALAVSLGQTFIITNAVRGWVEYSAAKHLPGLLPVLDRVRVVSARSEYEPEYPGQIGKWKNEAFLEIQRQLDSQVITNIVSVGDSELEMQATLVMARQFRDATVKTVKFQMAPSAVELAQQLELVCKEFRRVVGNARSVQVWTHVVRQSDSGCSR